MKQLIKLALVLLSAAILASCASGHKRSGSADAQAHTMGAGSVDSYWGDDLATADENQLLDRRVYYFDLDSSAINSNYARSIKAHARYLKDNPKARVRVEGHTDERGSSEYNIALGERRAQAVANMLTANGAAVSQVAIVSYGKEKPAEQGHDEDAWKYNRRAIIVYEVN